MKEILCLLALTGTIATISLTGCNKISDQQLQVQLGYKTLFGYEDISKCDELFTNENNIESCKTSNEYFSEIKNTEGNRLTGFTNFIFDKKTETSVDVSILPIHKFKRGQTEINAKTITATLDLVDGIWVIKHSSMFGQ